MKIFISDLYVNCDNLRVKANELYNIIKLKQISKDDELYFYSMNEYLNKYDKFKENTLKQYITDLNHYI